MAKNTGSYYLIREDIENEYIEYFDFENMEFLPKITKGVVLSTIDSLTTMFLSESDLSDYIDKVESIYKYTYKIIHKSFSKKEDKVLNVIWNDKYLSSISKISDSKVDFTSDYNFFILYEIINAVKDKKNGLVKTISSSKKESTKLSDRNKKIILDIANTNKEPSPKVLMEIFSDYNEFRALYLNYKYNKELDKNNFKEKLKRLSLILKD